MENISFQKVFGAVSWYCTDDEGPLLTNKLNNLLYFPDSPVNALSATSLSALIKDDEGTWVLTKRKYYFFTWDFGWYKKTIAYSENFLPELEIQAGFSKFSGFSKRVASISRYSKFNFSFAYICAREDPITGMPMDFTPEV